MNTPIYLETGKKRVFACAVDWPGWCRSGRTEEAAIEALAASLPRYAKAAERAGIPFVEPPPAFMVVERITGNGTTDFGAPGVIPALDRDPIGAEARGRLARLVRAAWQELDAAVATAPAVLPKGPRGGGRDRDEVVRHVLAAETAYGRSIGARGREPAVGDTAAIATHRDGLIAAIETFEPEGRAWPIPYACRRIAWHVLDHAWEIEDKGAAARSS